MDGQFKKDDMVQMCDTIKAFTLCRRKENQHIKDYINEFESLYMKAKKKGLSNLPPEYLTFMLFENSELETKDQRLALVEVDFSNKNEMVENSKKNLLKLFGGIKSLTEEANDTIRVVEENSTFFNNGYSQRGGMQYRGMNHGYNRRPDDQRFGAPQSRTSGTASGGGASPKILATKLNPQKFGKTMECHQCGAITHLMSACPELNGWTFMNYPKEEAEAMLAAMASQHKSDQTSMSPKDEYFEIKGEHDVVDYVANAAAVLQENEHTNSSFFNTFHVLYSEEKKKVLNIGALKGAMNRIILDTGCIRTVTGKAWMNNLIASMDPDTWKLIKIDRSSHGFKFGVGDTQRSLGKYIIPIKLGSSNFMLTTDVIETDIPCLLSKAAMVKSNMVIVIDMANN